MNTKNINTNRKNLVYLKYPHHGTQPYFFMRKIEYIPKSIKIETLSILIKSFRFTFFPILLS